MDVFALIILGVITLILLIANIYIYAYYAHPEDNSRCSGNFGKIVIFIGMTLCWAQVLLLPLDVANNRGTPMGFRMDIVWIVTYCLVAAFIFFVIPITSGLNECEEDQTVMQKIRYSFCSYIVTAIVFFGILIALFAFFNVAEIPIRKTNCSVLDFQASNSVAVTSTTCKSQDSNMSVNVSFPIFMIGLMSFFSWFLLIVFGSIGMSSLPLDCLREFCGRPQKISKELLEQEKRQLLERSKNIRNLAVKVKEMEKMGFNKKACK